MVSVQSYTKAIAQSLRLLPVSLFAISQQAHVSFLVSSQLVLLLHVLVFPSAYMFELQVKNGNTKVITPALAFDVAALFIASFMSYQVLVLVAAYTLVYKLYFHPVVRIKKYAILSLIMVMLTNGALIFSLVDVATTSSAQTQHALAIQATSILVGAFYMLSLLFTQKEDAQFGDVTLATRMGTKRLINFATILFVVSLVMMLLHFVSTKQLFHFYLFMLFFAPVAAYFRWWARQGKANEVVFESKFTIVFFNLATIAFSLYALVLLLM